MRIIVDTYELSPCNKEALKTFLDAVEDPAVEVKPSPELIESFRETAADMARSQDPGPEARGMMQVVEPVLDPAEEPKRGLMQIVPEGFEISSEDPTPVEAAEPEKPKRKRRTKAEIQAAREAEEAAQRETEIADAVEEDEDIQDAILAAAGDPDVDPDEAEDLFGPGVEEETSEAPSAEDVIELAQKLVAENKGGRVRAVLNKMGVRNVPALTTPELRSEFVKRVASITGAVEGE